MPTFFLAANPENSVLPSITLLLSTVMVDPPKSKKQRTANLGDHLFCCKVKAGNILQKVPLKKGQQLALDTVACVCSWSFQNTQALGAHRLSLEAKQQEGVSIMPSVASIPAPMSGWNRDRSAVQPLP